MKKELTPIELNRLSEDGDYAVGGVAGLYLQVRGGSKTWILRATIGSKRRKMGLGSYPSVSLSTARELARDAKQLIMKGIDPIEERKEKLNQLKLEQAKRFTFKDASLAYIEIKEPEWKNIKHASQWRNTLATYAYPIIGSTPVADIELEHILGILRPIWLTKTETASRVRGRIEKIIDWAIFNKYRDQANPARWNGNLEFVLQQKNKIQKVKHHPAVQWEDAPEFVRLLLLKKSVSAKSLLFHILTVARPGEARSATFGEIDFDKKERLIPAAKMKMDRDHRIPLSRQVMELLEGMDTSDPNAYLFQSKKGQMLSDMAMTKLMRDMNFKDRTDGRVAVPHGFRSTFTDWASEHTNHQNMVVKMAKAHKIGNEVEEAYRRGDLLRKRRELMQDWADYCFSLVTNRH